MRSHPVWVRGLKPGAESQPVGVQWSHPVWVRGLKQKKIVVTDVTLKSHPVWVRGLKPWIYTTSTWNGCRTPCGCVD